MSLQKNKFKYDYPLFLTYTQKIIWFYMLNGQFDIQAHTLKIPFLWIILKVLFGIKMVRYFGGYLTQESGL